MDHNSRLFVTALRAACDRALSDGRCGTQTNHIEAIEMTFRGLPKQMRVTCYGDYSPEESQRVFKDVSLVDVMDMVASYIAGRAMYDLEMENLQ